MPTNGAGADLDYFTISNEIAEVVRLNLPDVTVLLEEPIIFGHESTPIVGVYHEAIDIPEAQPLAMGRVQHEVMGVAVWVWVFAIDVQTAVRMRSQLRRRVRNVLMLNRDLNGYAETLHEVGGNLASARVENNLGFVAGAELSLRVRVKISL